MSTYDLPPEGIPFILGVLTPFLVIALLGAWLAMKEKLAEWREKSAYPPIFTGVIGQCPRCEWKCNVYTTPRRAQRRGARKWVREHIRDAHSESKDLS